MRLLLVEDSAADARLLREALADARPGFECMITEVSTIAAAEAVLLNNRFDCVLLDLHLPDARGVGNVDRIRGVRAQQAVVVTTGLDDEQTALHTLQRGAQDYVLKGKYTSEVLVRVIRRAIERNRLLTDIDKLREQHYYHATHDGLTGLPNRQLFMDRARKSLAQAARDGRGLAVCWIDLDGFKPINDQLGHAAGDEVLRHVATAISQAIRETDTAARCGGDEFCVLLTPLHNRSEAELICKRVLDGIRQIRLSGSGTLRVAASAGLALYPDNGAQIDMLLAAADQAMYQAKAAGRGKLAIGDGRSPLPAS